MLLKGQEVIRTTHILMEEYWLESQWQKRKLAYEVCRSIRAVSSAISSGRISSVGGDPTIALTSISNLISNLQDIEPVGRVVTEFDLIFSKGLLRKTSSLSRR